MLGYCVSCDLGSDKLLGRIIGISPIVHYACVIEKFSFIISDPVQFKVNRVFQAKNLTNINVVVCSGHVKYAFQRESTIYSCLNVRKLLARSRREIWSLSDCNWTWNQNHLVRKQTLNPLTKWLSVRLRTKWFWVRVQLQSLLMWLEKTLEIFQM